MKTVNVTKQFRYSHDQKYRYYIWCKKTDQYLHRDGTFHSTCGAPNFWEYAKDAASFAKSFGYQVILETPEPLHRFRVTLINNAGDVAFEYYYASNIDAAEDAYLAKNENDWRIRAINKI